MTKNGIQAILDLYKDRVQGIGLDNERFIYLNYPNGPKWSDIQFVTLGGEEFIKLSQKIDPSMGSEQVTKVSFHEVDCVQHIVAVEEADRYLDIRAIN